MVEEAAKDKAKEIEIKLKIELTEAIPPDDMKEECSRLSCDNQQRILKDIYVNYPVFTLVMAIYHYVERIWRVLIIPNI